MGAIYLNQKGFEEPIYIYRYIRLWERGNKVRHGDWRERKGVFLGR